VGTGRNWKFLKKVVLKFFAQMCSGEFFLKHALVEIIEKSKESPQFAYDKAAGRLLAA